MSLTKPPILPPNGSDEMYSYLQELEQWSFEVYRKLKNIEIGELTLTASAAAASGGQDGDIHFRVNGANTSIAQNINGVWTINS